MNAVPFSVTFQDAQVFQSSPVSLTRLQSPSEPDSCRRSPVVIRGMPPASPFQSPQKRDVTGRVTRVSTAPKIKPVKGAGKQKGPAQTARGEADISTPSLFQQAVCAARDLWLGPPDGELGKIGELENETWGCERSTAEAIRSAEPTKKLSALRRGVDELQDKLCA